MPEILVKGCKYFIKEEGIVIIDHGDGPIEYGSKVKTHVPLDGRLYAVRNETWERVPDEETQDQLNKLGEASLSSSVDIALNKADLKILKHEVDALLSKIEDSDTKELSDKIDLVSTRLTSIESRLDSLENA